MKNPHGSLNGRMAITTLDANQAFAGVCHRLNVDGILFETSYVPREGEILHVEILPSGYNSQGLFREQGGLQPLVMQVEVRWCHEVVAGQTYAIGAAICRDKVQPPRK